MTSPDVSNMSRARVRPLTHRSEIVYDTDQIADQVERLEQRIREVASHRPELAPQGAQLPPTLDRGIDELPSHRRALSSEEMSLRTPDAPFRLDGLEEHLRHVTEQIETLKRPALEEAIRTLRAELSEHRPCAERGAAAPRD